MQELLWCQVGMPSSLALHVLIGRTVSEVAFRCGQVWPLLLASSVRLQHRRQRGDNGYLGSALSERPSIAATRRTGRSPGVAMNTVTKKHTRTAMIAMVIRTRMGKIVTMEMVTRAITGTMGMRTSMGKIATMVMITRVTTGMFVNTNTATATRKKAATAMATKRRNIHTTATATAMPRAATRMTAMATAMKTVMEDSAMVTLMVRCRIGSLTRAS
mmetsp:Transcript_68280/g.177264  ORF Transcript_68280/g.177264 Transcript_68280/m.177264 type:complete len:216 (+) Transcript_68280:286-933(+)